jgi:hypothetical protein
MASTHELNRWDSAEESIDLIVQSVSGVDVLRAVQVVTNEIIALRIEQ